jgi:RNA polymerase sigma factor (sigma-70 family)
MKTRMPPFDDAAFEDCYRRTYPLVVSKCRRMVRGHSDAADLAQEVFVRLWNHRTVVLDVRALTAWLYRTSTHLAIDRARRRSLSRDSLQHLEALVGDQNPDDAEGRLASRQELRSMLGSVPTRELEAAVLSRFDRLAHPEIAEVMGVAERTVRRLLERFDRRTKSIKESAP